MSQNSSFIEYLKKVENDQLANGNLTYLRHSSPEGGLDTIGYGHKITKKEQEDGVVYGHRLDQLTEQAAEDIFKTDLRKKESRLRKRIPNWNKLDQRKREMLLDYEYNLGNVSKVFPSFTRAVLADDVDGQRKEFMRTYKDAAGTTRPLARNKVFYERYLSTGVTGVDPTMP